MTLLNRLVLLVLLGGCWQALAEESKRSTGQAPWVSPAVHHDVSPPLLLMPHKPFVLKRKPPEHRLKPVPRPFQPPGEDPARQFLPSLEGPMPAPLLSFDGLGQNFLGPGGPFPIVSAPPDTVGDVGPNHYVQVVNQGFAIYDRQRQAFVVGPVATNTLWYQFGGGCEENNDGDGIVLYDSIADRWFITQFSVSTKPYLQCVAVSRTGDPIGQYYRYAFEYGKFPDYGKFGVWPDGYYANFNLYEAFELQGGLVCAYDRGRMLEGQSASQVCFLVDPPLGGLLLSDLDGVRLPPLGSPNYVAGFDYRPVSALKLWAFRVDWKDPPRSRLVRLEDIPVANITLPCGGNGGSCIPQAGTSTQLDTLADRLMFRLAYRNFGTHESLVMNHTVALGAGSGIRWYEVRRVGEQPLSLHQQGTYGWDNEFRWMGSIAMDQAGNMAAGFSHSTAATHPSIRLAGRLFDDPLHVLPQGEDTLVEGGGSQTDAVERWGDYSMMSVDPVDDCTFWFTGEYLGTTGVFNWNSHISAFRYPSCPTQWEDDFSLSISPTNGRVSQSSPALFAVKTQRVRGQDGMVTLAVEGLPPELMATFTPPNVSTDGSATLTITASASAELARAVPFNVVGSMGPATHVLLATIEVVEESNGFSLKVSPPARTLTAGASTDFVVETAVTSGVAEPIAFSASGLPTGVEGSFNPASVLAGERATLVLSAAPTAPEAVASVTVSGTSPSASSSASATVTVEAVSDFFLGLEPSALTVESGNKVTFRIVTELAAGARQPISFEVQGLPEWAVGTIAPATVMVGESATLELAIAADAPGSNISFQVRGRTASAQKEVTGSVAIVNAFMLHLSPESQSVPAGEEAIFEISTQVVSGSPEPMTFSISGLPEGVESRFVPQQILSGGSARLILRSRGLMEESLAFSVRGYTASGMQQVLGQLSFHAPELRVGGGGCACTSTRPLGPGMHFLLFLALATRALVMKAKSQPFQGR